VHAAGSSHCCEIKSKSAFSRYSTVWRLAISGLYICLYIYVSYMCVCVVCCVRPGALGQPWAGALGLWPLAARWVWAYLCGRGMPLASGLWGPKGTAAAAAGRVRSKAAREKKFNDQADGAATQLPSYIPYPYPYNKRTSAPCTRSEKRKSERALLCYLKDSVLFDRCRGWHGIVVGERRVNDRK
jgi:hypothetical protein